MQNIIYTHPCGRYKVEEMTLDGCVMTRQLSVSETERKKICRRNGKKYVPGKTKTVTPADKSTKKIYAEYKHDAHLAKLMNCRNIDKFFGRDHQFQQVKKPAKLPGISAINASMKLLEPDTRIVKHDLRSVLMQGEYELAFVQSRVLKELLKDGDAILVSDPGIDEVYESPVNADDFLLKREKSQEKIAKNAVTPAVPHVDPPHKGATPMSPIEQMKSALFTLMGWIEKNPNKCAVFERVVGYREKICSVEGCLIKDRYAEFEELSKSELETLKNLYWAYPNANFFWSVSVGNRFYGRFYL